MSIFYTVSNLLTSYFCKFVTFSVDLMFIFSSELESSIVFVLAPADFIKLFVAGFMLDLKFLFGLLVGVVIGLVLLLCDRTPVAGF